MYVCDKKKDGSTDNEVVEGQLAEMNAGKAQRDGRPWLIYYLACLLPVFAGRSNRGCDPSCSRLVTAWCATAGLVGIQSASLRAKASAGSSNAGQAPVRGGWPIAALVMMDKHSSALHPHPPTSLAYTAALPRPSGWRPATSKTRVEAPCDQKNVARTISSSALCFPSPERLPWLKKRRIAQHGEAPPYDWHVGEAWGHCHSRL